MVGEYVEVESGKSNDRPKLRQALHRAKVTGATLENDRRCTSRRVPTPQCPLRFGSGRQLFGTFDPELTSPDSGRDSD